MAGGEVEFSLPTGWAITKSLTVIADPDPEAVTAGVNDPYVRYGTSFLVEVHERIGSSDTASASFGINRDGKNAELDTDGTLGDADA